MLALSPNPVRPLVIALAVIGGALCFGQSVTASCGDYLAIKNAKSGGVGLLADKMADGLSEEVPCHGPNCSLNSGPDHLPLTSTSFMLPVPETDSAVLARQANDNSASEFAEWWHPASKSNTVSHPFLPFHPPKSSS